MGLHGRHATIIWLSTAALLGQSGCARSLPPLVEVRPTLGTIGIVIGHYQPEAEFRTPAKGKVGGAGRGAAIGALVGLGLVAKVGEQCYDEACLVFLALMPPAAAIGAVAGGITGIVKAQDGAQVEAGTAALQSAAARLDVQEGLRNRVLQLARAETSHHFVLLTEAGPRTPKAMPGYRALADEGIDSVLELRVTSFGLKGEFSINPPSEPMLEVRVRLVRVQDDSEMYDDTLRCCTNELVDMLTWKRPFEDWTKDDAQPFVAALDVAQEQLADEIVREMFGP